MKEDTIIRLTGINMRRDRRVVLRDVSFTVERGDFVAITGPNGGGKTTLLRIILGLLRPSSGTVEIARGTTIGYLPQKTRIDSHFPITVQEVVESGLLGLKSTAEEVRRAAQATLQRVGMSDYARQPIGALSGGQLQRVLLARAIISSPNLLVLDEPLSYLDKHFESELYGLIALLARDATVLLVSHEMTEIAAMANRHLIVDRSVHMCHASRHYVRTDCDE